MIDNLLSFLSKNVDVANTAKKSEKEKTAKTASDAGLNTLSEDGRYTDWDRFWYGDLGLENVSHSQEYDDVDKPSAGTNSLENILFEDPATLEEGRAKPNHNLDLSDAFGENSDNDSYNILLGMADVANGAYQNLSQLRKTATGATSDHYNDIMGVDVDGQSYTLNELKKAGDNVYWTTSDGDKVYSSELPNNTDDIVYSDDGSKMRLNNGNWINVNNVVPIYQDIIENDGRNGTSEIGDKTGSYYELSKAYDDIARSVAEGKNPDNVYQLDEGFLNMGTVDSSDGNPINLVLGALGRKDNDGNDYDFNAGHVLPWLTDMVLGSAPYFNPVTGALLTGANMELAANGYDVDSYDLSTGTYSDTPLNLEQRRAAMASALAEVLSEKIGGLGKTKNSIDPTFVEEVLSPLDRNMFTRSLKEGVIEGGEEVLSELVDMYKDSTKLDENGERNYTWDSPGDLVDDAVNRSAQAFSGGAALGSILHGRNELNPAYRSFMQRPLGERNNLLSLSDDLRGESFSLSPLDLETLTNGMSDDFKQALSEMDPDSEEYDKYWNEILPRILSKQRGKQQEALSEHIEPENAFVDDPAYYRFLNELEQNIGDYEGLSEEDFNEELDRLFDEAMRKYYGRNRR